MAKIIERRIIGDNKYAFMADTELSLKAKGMLSQVLTLDVRTFNEIENLNHEGTIATKNAIKDLEELGYLERERELEDGKFGSIIYRFSNRRLFTSADNFRRGNSIVAKFFEGGE